MRIWLVFSFLFLATAYSASIDRTNYTAIESSRLQPKKYISRVFGGSPASTNQFAFYAYIIAQGIGESSSCGGSILSSTWLLTAAHCAQGYLSLDIYLGSTDVYDMPVILTSTNWITHPNYDPNTYNNDLTVVELTPAVAFTPSIQPVSLVASAQAGNSFVGQSALVMGFGYTSDSDPTESPDLLYASVQVISNIACTSSYGPNIVTSGTICAQGVSKQSICSGDSGGPMVIDNGNGGYTQVGINSFVSNAGCTGGYPSGYVRAGSYLGWIASMTGVPIS